jgi:hypothetical protein
MIEIDKPLPGENGRGEDDEESTRVLLRAAGTRPLPPAEEIEAISDAARVEWRRRYGARRKLSTGRFVAVAAAAVIVLAAGLVLLLRRSGARVAGSPAATVARFAGDVRIGPDEGTGTGLLASDVGRLLVAGSVVRTAVDGRVAFRMAGGASVRFDAGTRARLLTATLVELSSGAVYVDTGREEGNAADVAVRTPLGLFEAVGTRFEVRAASSGESARLRVRDGTVALRREEGAVMARAGQTLSVGSDGTVHAGTTSLSGPDWEWTGKAAPMPSLEGRTAREVLDWVSRETGWRIETKTEEVARIVDSTILHGSIDHLTPYDVPEVVLPSCGLAHHLEDGVLVVEAETRRAPPVDRGRR